MVSPTALNSHSAASGVDAGIAATASYQNDVYLETPPLDSHTGGDPVCIVGMGTASVFLISRHC